MNTKERPNRIKLGKRKLPGRFGIPSIVIAAILTLLLASMVVLGARAVAVAWQDEGGALVIQVPDDYPTIQTAINASGPGDIIRVSAGTYNENLVLNKPISLVAETYDQINPVNNTTIIDGGGSGTTILISPGLTQMPTIRGFVIRNGEDNIQASSPFIAEFNYIHSANNLVSYQLGSGGFNRNNLYFGARDNAIRLDNMNRQLLIENNRIMYSANSGIEVSLQNTTAPPAVVEIDIWNNMILGNHEDGVQLIDHPGDPQDTNRRLVIAGNLIANNKKAGIGLMSNANTLEDYSGADVSEAVRVFNNTFYGNDYGISGGDNLVAFNNVFANSGTRGVWRVQGAPGMNSVIAYSLFHNNKVDAEETSLGAGVIVGLDPLFQAAPNPGPDGTWETVDDDFSGLVIQSGSPAIDKGIAQFMANNGEAVPPSPITGFIGAPDLGWRELGSPIFITPSPTPIASSTPLGTTTAETPSPAPTTTPGSPTTTPPTVTPVTPALSATATTVPATLTATTVPPPTATPTSSFAIQRIDPTTAQADIFVLMTITGSGFQSGAVVTFEGGLGLPQEIINAQVINSTTIVLLMTPRNDGAFGPQIWDVRVTNPDNSTTVLADAFTVTPAPGSIDISLK